MFKLGEKIKIIVSAGNISKVLEGKLLHIPYREGVDYWVIENEYINSDGNNQEVIGIPSTSNIILVSQITTQEIKEDGEPQEEKTPE